MFARVGANVGMCRQELGQDPDATASILPCVRSLAINLIGNDSDYRHRPLLRAPRAAAPLLIQQSL
jgi:hypothetical protein